MSGVVDILEERVLAAAALIASLRVKVRSLERQLSATPPGKVAAPDVPPTPSLPESALAAELERLRAERVAVRDSIRSLIREIDRIPW